MSLQLGFLRQLKSLDKNVHWQLDFFEGLQTPEEVLPAEIWLRDGGRVLVGLDGKQVAEHCPLLRGELRGVASRTEHLLPLLRRHLAELLEGAADGLLPVLGHLRE